MYTESVARISCRTVLGANSHFQEQDVRKSNIDMELRGLDCEGGRWKELAQDRVQCLAGPIA